jgi:syntaxin 7
MSFNVDIEAQRNIAASSFSSETKIGIIITKASNLLTDFANGVNTLERLVNQLGTKRDSIALRKTIDEVRIPELNEYKQQLEHLTNDISHLITNSDIASSEDKFSEEKLRKEFDSIKKSFNQTRRNYNERQSSVILKDRIADKTALNEESCIVSHANENTPLTQQNQVKQQYTIPQQDLDLHTILAEERANEIKKIHGGVEEINSIYKQLGFLVQQQGSQVDTVESNMSNLASHTQNASRELLKADNYQKQKRKWSCIILVILVILALIVVLAVFT